MKKTYILFLMLVLLSASVAYAGYAVAKKAGEYGVAIVFDRNQPITAGDNKVYIAIRDAAKEAVKDAQVKIESTMSAMPGLPPMNNETEAVAEGNGYQATIPLSMPGSWNIVVRITREGKSTSMEFTVDAR